MKIAILGAGKVGTALGGGLDQAGHDVSYGVRDPAKSQAAPAGATLKTMAEASAEAEVVFLTVPWTAAQSVVQALGDMKGKVLVDVTNPIGPGFALTLGHTDSGGEQVARWAPSARVVKAFNTNGVEVMRAPVFPEGAAVMPICGNDSKAVELVAELAQDLGYEVVTFPSLEVARLLEPLTLLWIKTSSRVGSREMGLRLMRR